MHRLQFIKLGLQVSLRVFVARSSILQLRVEPRLHFGLLEQHLLPHFIDRFLVLNRHSIRDPAHLLASLAQLALHLLAADFQIRQRTVHFRVNLAELAIR